MNHAQRWEKRDGKIYRTIYKIDRLYDIANCWTGAYAEASTHRNTPDEYVKYINEVEAREAAEKQAEEDAKKAEILSKLDERMKEFYKKINI